MRRRSLQREQTSVCKSLRGGRRLIFIYPLFRFSVFFHSVDDCRKNRDLKSNPLLVGELTTQNRHGLLKKYFSQNGCGVFKQSSVLLNSFRNCQKAQKSAWNCKKLFKKMRTPFCEHSLFLLVLKDCRNVAIEEFAQSVEVIPWNSLSTSQFLNCRLREQFLLAKVVRRKSFLLQRFKNINFVF